VLQTSTRVLRLLSLLQTRTDWSGRELGARLAVDVRTLRRDIDRLRALGYAIDASSGVGGGYRLGQGHSTPPILLDDDEAVAVAVSLAANGGAAGAEAEVAVRVLAKLNQVLPPRVRLKLGAISEATLLLPDDRPRVDFRTLATLAGACRDAVETGFAYRDARGEETRRSVEPLRLVHMWTRWYLVAWDLGRADFRTFRLDRISGDGLEVLGRRFMPRTPEEGLEAYVKRSLLSAPYRFQARLRLTGRLADWRARLPAWLGTLEAASEETVIVTLGADSEAALLALIMHLDAPFELLEPMSLGPVLERAAGRLLAATR
jgi:predicted DNA-binding transcriptional regulator YafY